MAESVSFFPTLPFSLSTLVSLFLSLHCKHCLSFALLLFRYGLISEKSCVPSFRSGATLLFFWQQLRSTFSTPVKLFFENFRGVLVRNFDENINNHLPHCYLVFLKKWEYFLPCFFFLGKGRIFPTVFFSQVIG